MAEYINIEEGVKRVMGQKPLYMKMLGMFLEGPEYDRLKQLLEDNDIPTARDVSHAIKGVAGNLSLTALYDANLLLLGALRSGSMPAREQIDAYDETLQRTREAVRELIGE